MSIIITIIKFYYFINFIHLNYAYFTLKKYYRKIICKDNETGKDISIQEKYAPLIPNDSINYFSFIFFGMIFFPIRIILILFIFYILTLHIKILKLIYKNQDKNENQRMKIEKAAYFWLSIYFFINNIKVEKKQIKYKEIYKKYLGDDYDFETKDFSIYISNHLGFLDIVTYIREYGVSLLVTFEVLRGKGVGSAMNALDSFFINRDDAKSRLNALKILEKRENDFFNKKSFIRTLIFPEGNTTNGEYISKFKKGAFILLLPVKPLMIIPYKGFPIQTNRYFSFVRIVASFKLKVQYAELPIINPTDFIFKKYKDYGKEKWEIYANVVNKIYSEIGGFKQCDIRFRDKMQYFKITENGFL